MRVLWCNIKGIVYTQEQKSIVENITSIKSQNYLRERDMIRHISGLLLAELGWYSMHGECVKIIYDEDRKPQYKFLDGYDDYHFNISHSCDIVVCAISMESVGVDIEKKSIFPQEIIDYIYNDNEIKCCQNDNGCAYKLWTRKESYLKAIGKGICGIRSMKSLIHEGKVSDNYEGYKFVELAINEEYEAVACTKADIDVANLIEVDGECLIQFMRILEQKKGW